MKKPYQEGKKRIKITATIDEKVNDDDEGEEWKKLLK